MWWNIMQQVLNGKYESWQRQVSILVGEMYKFQSDMHMCGGESVWMLACENEEQSRRKHLRVLGRGC